MVGIKTLTIVVVLCCFATYHETFGLERNLDKKDDREEDVSPEMRRNIRKLLQHALKKIDESDVLRVLKKSLYFRMRMCLSRPRVPGSQSPSSVGKNDILNDTSFPFSLRKTGGKEDFTKDQRRGLRMILQDALKEIDDEEILRALKLSLALKLRLCLRAPLRPSGYPRPFPTRFNKRTSPTSKPAQPSPGETSSPKPNPAKPGLGKPSSTRPSPTKPRPGKPSAGSASSAKPSLGKPSSARPSPAKPRPGKPSRGRARSAKPSQTKPNPAKPTAGKVTSPKARFGKPRSPKPSPAKLNSAGRKARYSKADQIFRQNKISSTEELMINGVSRPDYLHQEAFSQTDFGDHKIDSVRPVAQFPEQIETENRQESKLDNALTTMEAVKGGSIEEDDEYQPHFQTGENHEIITEKDVEFDSVPEINF